MYLMDLTLKSNAEILKSNEIVSTDLVEKTKNQHEIIEIKFNENDSLAIIAYAQFVNKASCDKSIIDNFLKCGLSKALEDNLENENREAVEIIVDKLMPLAKSTLTEFCQLITRQSRNEINIVDFSLQEFDIQFLESLSYIYSKKYIERYYNQGN